MNIIKNNNRPMFINAGNDIVKVNKIVRMPSVPLNKRRILQTLDKRIKRSAVGDIDK